MGIGDDSAILQNLVDVGRKGFRKVVNSWNVQPERVVEAGFPTAFKDEHLNHQGTEAYGPSTRKWD